MVWCETSRLILVTHLNTGEAPASSALPQDRYLNASTVKRHDILQIGLVSLSPLKKDFNFTKNISSINIKLWDVNKIICTGFTLLKGRLEYI